MKRVFQGNRAVILLIFGVLVSSTAFAADWPQLLGPSGNGKSSETGLAKTWPAGGPKVVWRVPLATGYSSPSISGGEVYVLDRMDGTKDVLRCLDFANGKELWNFVYDAPGEVSHDGSRVPPTVDAQYVYTVGMMGHFHCIDRKTHKPVWSKNLVTDFGLKGVPGWGITQAPALYNDLVIVAPQAPGRVRGGVQEGHRRTGLEECVAGASGLFDAGGDQKSTVRTRLSWSARRTGVAL